jgi:hypothetical protein
VRRNFAGISKERSSCGFLSPWSVPNKGMVYSIPKDSCLYSADSIEIQTSIEIAFLRGRPRQDVGLNARTGCSTMHPSKIIE